MLTKLTINICANSDEDALRVLARLTNMMDVASGEDCAVHLKDSGYTSSHVSGSGDAMVIHIEYPTKLIAKQEKEGRT